MHVRLRAAFVAWGGSGGGISVTDNGTTTSASAVVTAVPPTFGIVPGMTVTGTDVPASTTVLSVDSTTQFTMSASATASGTAVALTIDKPSTAYVTSAAQETVRQTINSWIAAQPLGVVGVFDFDKVTRVESEPGLADSNYISTYRTPTPAAACGWLARCGSPDRNHRPVLTGSGVRRVGTLIVGELAQSA